MDNVEVPVDVQDEEANTFTEAEIIAEVAARLRKLSAKWPEGRTLEEEPGQVSVIQGAQKVTLKKYLNFCESFKRSAEDPYYHIVKGKSYSCTYNGVPRIGHDSWEEFYAHVIDDFKCALKGKLEEFT